MRGRLTTRGGFWAVEWSGGRVDLTRFSSATKAENVLLALRRDFPGADITGPAEPGWLFDELWEVTPLFGGETK